MKPYIRTGLICSAVVVLATGVISLVTMNKLPHGVDIPVHWGPSGEPDRFASRSEALWYVWLVPAITVAMTALFAAIPYIDPRQRNIDTGRRAYLAAWIGAMVLMALIHLGVSIMMVRAGSPANGSVDFVRWVIAGCGALFILIGNYLPKTRSSFMFGIRTPWTLSSDIAWEKTHRLAGPLFMLAGALGIAGAFLFDGILLALQLTALVLGAAIISVVYSYFAWRKAEDRDAGTGHIV